MYSVVRFFLRGLFKNLLLRPNVKEFWKQSYLAKVGATVKWQHLVSQLPVVACFFVTPFKLLWFAGECVSSWQFRFPTSVNKMLQIHLVFATDGNKLQPRRKQNALANIRCNASILPANVIRFRKKSTPTVWLYAFPKLSWAKRVAIEVCYTTH